MTFIELDIYTQSFELIITCSHGCVMEPAKVVNLFAVVLGTLLPLAV